MTSQKSKKTADKLQSENESKVGGDVSQSVVITGNNNVVNVDERESKGTSSKKRSRKTNKLPLAIVIAIISAIATLLAALIGILPQLIKSPLTPTTTTTNTVTITLPPPSMTSTTTSTPTLTSSPSGCDPNADILFEYALNQSSEIASALGKQTRDHSRCIQSSYQTFEGGEMIWLSGDPNIYVLYAKNEWEAYKNNFVYNTEVPCDASSLPSKRYQPKLGFGKIWCENQNVREKLGYATHGERKNDRTILTFESGWLVLMDYTVRAVFYDKEQWESIDVFDYELISLESRPDLDPDIGNLGLEQEETRYLPQSPLTMRDPDTGKLLVVPFQVGSKISTQCHDKAGFPETIQIPANISHPVRVYLLIQAGWGVSSYEYRQIGNVSLKFDNGKPLDTSLVLGLNIRDWADREIAIKTVNSPYSQTAWVGQAPDGMDGKIDVLVVDIPEIYTSLVLKEIQIDDMSRIYSENADMDPCIHLSAVTVAYLPVP